MEPAERLKAFASWQVLVIRFAGGETISCLGTPNASFDAMSKPSDELIERELLASPEASRWFAYVAAEAVKLPMALVSQKTCEIKFCNSTFRLLSKASTADFCEVRIHKVDATESSGAFVETSVREFVKGLGESFSDIRFEAELPGPVPRNLSICLGNVETDGQGLVLITIEDITHCKDEDRIVVEQQNQLRLSVAIGTAELEETNRELQDEIVRREQIEAALHKSEDALLRSREELRHLSASLMNAQDAERRRVARELHDDLSQKVAKLQFDAETLEQQVPFEDIAAAKKRLRDVGQQAAIVSEDLRRVAHQLHPATLDHLGLVIALRSYAEEFSRSTAIPVKVTGINVPRELPIQISSGLFRIVQEALRNVAKHTSDCTVEIVISGLPGGLSLFVRDDGAGFDVDAARKKGGLGLISMQERARLLDGTLSLDTQPGKGVLLTIECPTASKT